MIFEQYPKLHEIVIIISVPRENNIAFALYFYREAMALQQYQHILISCEESGSLLLL